MNLVFETKYALRQLRKSPTYTGLSFFVICSSVAISLVVFSLVYRMLLKPLDFPQSEQWYMVQTLDLRSNTLMQMDSVDAYTYRLLSEARFESVAKVSGANLIRIALNEGSSTVSLHGARISVELLKETAVSPLLGRTLQDDDAFERVAMLSYDTWRSYYGADPSVIGRNTRINGEATTIIGVLPNDFGFVFSADVWLPFTQPPVSEPSLQASLSPLVKLRNGFSLSAATEEVSALFKDIKQRFPEIYTDRELRLVPLHLAGNENGSQIYQMMAIVAAALSFFSCMNVGALLYAKVLGRSKELAIRNAVGGDRWQVVGQSLLESLFLCIAGAAAGVLLGAFALLLINGISEYALAAQGFSYSERRSLEIGPLEIAFIFFVTTIIWLVIGIVPAIRSSKQETARILASGGKGASGSHHYRSASVLVCVQLVFACFLLIVSGSLVISINTLIQTDYGIKTANRITAQILLSDVFKSEQQRRDYLQRLGEELKAQPELGEFAFTSALPGGFPAPPPTPYQLEGQDDNSGRQIQRVAPVSNNYFKVAGIEIVQGRPFDAGDNKESLPVIIVDERFAAQHWPGEHPIGKRIRAGAGETSEWLTVVGVSSHVLARAAFLPDNEFIAYRPISQQIPTSVRVIGEAKADLSLIRPRLIELITKVERDLPLINLQVLDDFYISRMSYTRMMSSIFLSAAVVTLLLAAVGIFAVLTRTILQRIHDIGVRRALGSSNQHVLLLFLRHGLLFLLTGCALGGGVALLIGDAVLGGSSRFLIPVSAAVVSTMALVVLAAVYLPARRATLMEPGDALRYE